jgi:hypothetical protein
MIHTKELWEHAACMRCDIATRSRHILCDTYSVVFSAISIFLCGKVSTVLLPVGRVLVRLLCIRKVRHESSLTISLILPLTKTKSRDTLFLLISHALISGIKPVMPLCYAFSLPSSSKSPIVVQRRSQKQEDCSCMQHIALGYYTLLSCCGRSAH